VASRSLRSALLFCGPAFLVLGALVVYPIIATVAFSFMDRTGRGFVGIDNYREMLTNPRILLAIRNNAIWVIVVPPVVTVFGLVFAVLTERIDYSRAFKAVIFMPMAISLVAGGVIWRVVYEEDPDRGLINAGIRAGESVFRSPGPYPGAAPSAGLRRAGEEIASTSDVGPGDAVALGLLQLSADEVPDEAQQAVLPRPREGSVVGAVYRDFTPGRRGTRGAVDGGEVGLPGAVVELRERDGSIAGTAVTDERGRFTIDDVRSGTFEVVLPSQNFRPAFAGIEWLGPTLVTPAIIAAYTWIWAGFAMIVIGAGLAAISREVLEAARVDGANEWQTFRYVTVPLLAPVLLVVLVTLVIYVLKVFDIVLVIAPSNVQDEANVIALEMWQTAFGARNLGLGSAVAVLLFAFVVPVMALNIKRFRSQA
jgi:alpha-glucoside transport system permease protein